MSENQNLTDLDERANQPISQQLGNSGQSGESSLSGRNIEIEPELANKFYALAKTWESEVEGMSSTSQMSQHTAYLEIIRMGNKVVPLLLQELKQNPLY